MTKELRGSGDISYVRAHATGEKAHIGRAVSAKGMWRGVIAYEDEILMLPLRNLVAVVILHS
jgi:hypothetical protein